jgi:hypothetical protein
MADQDVRSARERVQALREQVREEQNKRAVAAADTAREARLTALTAEERHLEAQLAEIQSIQMPGEGSVPSVAVPGEPIEGALDPTAEPPEGGFVETVDPQGNIVRMPAGTLEGEAPPPNVPDDATMTGRPSGT